MQKRAEEVQKRADYLEYLRQKHAELTARLDKIEEARTQQTDAVRFL